MKASRIMKKVLVKRVKVLRVQTKKKGRRTERMKSGLAKTEKVPRNMAGRIKEGKKKSVVKVERIPVKMKRR